MLEEYPIDHTTYAFVRPDKGERKFIFGMLVIVHTVDGEQSVNLDMHATSHEDRKAWIEAIRRAKPNVDEDSTKETYCNINNCTII